jgi:hypothetical protein
VDKWRFTCFLRSLEFYEICWRRLNLNPVLFREEYGETAEKALRRMVVFEEQCASGFFASQDKA